MAHQPTYPPAAATQPEFNWSGWLCSCAPGLLFFALFAFLRVTCDGWRWDETYTWKMIHHPALAIIQATARDVHPPLYYLLLHQWVAIHDAPWMMQAYGLLMSGLTLVLLTAFVTHHRGARAAQWTGLGLGSCIGFVHFSQDARMYPQCLMFETLAVLGWAMTYRRPWRGWLVLASAAAATCYSHNFGLVFVVFLISLAWFQLLRLPAPRPRHSGPAALCGTLLLACVYAPWFPVALRQRSVNYLGSTFDALPTAEFLTTCLQNYYTMGQQSAGAILTWLPGAALLGLLPLCLLLPAPRRWLTRQGGNWPHIPPWWPFWLGWAPLICLQIYSRYTQPVLDVSRHGFLFLPLAFVAAGSTLAWYEASRPRLGLAAAWLLMLVAVVVSAGPAVRFSDGPPPGLQAALQQAIAPGEPLLIYPLEINVPMRWGLTAPEPTTQSTDFMLAVTGGPAYVRSARFDRLQRLVGEVGQVIPIYADYQAIALRLRHVPLGFLQKIFDLCTPEPLPTTWFGLPFASFWVPEQIHQVLDAHGQLLGTADGFSYARGIRLPHTGGTLSFPLPPSPPTRRSAVLASIGVKADALPTTIQCQLAPYLPLAIALDTSQHIVSSWATPGEPTLNMKLTVPETATSDDAPRGDQPNGTYLFWLARIAVDLPTTAPVTIDVGSPSDELYLRAGFHEREGVGAQQIRWTARRFSIDIPLLPYRTYRTITLQGMLPDAIHSRLVTLTAQTSGGVILTASAKAPSGWTALTFTFPQPLQGDLARFDFALDGAWIPARETPGGQGDPRELGFYLDALELR